MRYLLTLLICVPLFAQPRVELMRFYDQGGENDYFNDVFVLDDGGSVVCGCGAGHPWILRLDEEGDTVWTRTFPNNSFGFKSVIETDDGDIIAAGNIGHVRFSAARLSPAGEIRWQNDYYPGCCYAVIELKSSVLALAGHGVIPEDRRFGALLVFTTEDGEVIDTFRYGFANEFYVCFHAMRETEDGLFLLGAYDYFRKNWTTLVDFDGRRIWARDEYRGTGDNYANSLVSCEGGFFFGGVHCIVNNTATGWIYRVRQDGTPAWVRYISDLTGNRGSAMNFVKSVATLRGVGVIGVGYSPGGMETPTVRL